ncbi:hypothetical protein F5B22DRAFT_656434 [Xylaria bambusicola]|uniref:uncharacterized protein n=1 Tax=Xylaria bambusicola TaxID=326684 RepID=UPI00200725BC|nr:uncharacterized protein F5B22DRAFT_656434 [Xylaria bambusicola]KAI0514918.1 hypothetical protein F5B22DRAFT_656434 [Xylaria bambusicola]
MSPVAYSGPVVTPSNGTTMSNNRGHAIDPAGKGPTGGVAYGRNSGSGKAPFRHIDDIVSVSVDLDPHTTLRKVLEAGDAHMRQAITYKDFGRPDFALQEYIKAFTIAVDKVPKHKDYPSLKSDRGDLGRLYHALKVKITNNGVAYDRIKEDIKEDNRRSGVLPTKSVVKSLDNLLPDLPSVPSKPPSQHSVSNPDTPHNVSTSTYATRSDHSSHDIASSGRKAKPTVHPKPQALHGNSIKSVPDNASPDLVARFAKLRDPQDSRNNFSSPPLAKPNGPRDLPLTHRPPLSVRSALPAMPKVPDAVYSPARGTVTSEAANLPSSTPRGMFSRTNSLASVPSTSSRTSMENIFRTFNGEQFITAHTYGEPQTASKSSLQISDGELITVQELLRYMRDGSTSIKTLIIDVRDRQLFDEGHIFSQNTICLDPTILSRPGISASDIVDSMILAPSNEKSALERRDEFDLIVFYDQDSKSIPQRITRNAEEAVVFNIQHALVHYGYPKQLKHTPKLLVGGLDAWIDAMGKQSLQTSDTQSIRRHVTSTSASARRRLRNRTLKPEEVNTFEDIIRHDEDGDFDYAKSQEDFMRRFPSIREPESMISGEKDGVSVRSMGSAGEEFLKDMSPTPPVRPKPAVARTRYSGLEPAEEHAPGALAMMVNPSSIPNAAKPTGLVNPGNWCYANASIQALLVSRGFIDEFLDPQWPTKYRPDVPVTDPSYNQLMCKILGNLFQWLSQKSFVTMKASTLMHYLRTIHTGYSLNGREFRFGDTHQHDSDEFITFMFGQLEAETRFKMSKNILPQLDTTQPVGFIVDRWGNRPNNTLMSRHWYLLELHTFACNNCQARNYIVEEAERYQFPVPQAEKVSLADSVQEHFAEIQVDSECDACKSRGKTLRKQLVRQPPLLRVGLQRTNQAGSIKTHTPVEFPFHNFDLEPYAIDGESRSQIANLLGGDAAEGFVRDTVYSLYAVVSHSGSNLNSGHYISYVKSDKGTWTQCNDTRITTGISAANAEKSLHNCENRFTPTQLYYKRVPR